MIYGRIRDPEEFRTNGYELIDAIAEYLETVGDRPVTPSIVPGSVRAMLSEHPPEAPESWSDVMADIDQIVLPTITHWQHPSGFAYFPGNSTRSSILGELLTAGLGVQGMSWVTSPAATEIETLMLDWMQELLGLPDRFRTTTELGGGAIQGSASEATLVAIVAARWRATGGAINATGDTLKLTAYTSDHATPPSRRDFESPASEPIVSGWWRAMPRSRCRLMRWRRSSPLTSRPDSPRTSCARRMAPPLRLRSTRQLKCEHL